MEIVREVFGEEFVQLFSEEEIKKRVLEMANQINENYKGTRELVIIIVTNGSIVFSADLLREITLKVKIDTIALTSYGLSKMQDQVRLIKDINRDNIDISGCDILIIEDIVDSGQTLKFAVEWLKKSNPNSVEICSLLDKPSKRVVNNLNVKYVGFTVPDVFIVGYGIDAKEYYRNLPFIGVLKE